VQIGSKDDEEKPRFAGLRPGQKMDAITLEQALELFTLPRTLGQTAAGETIVANVGRFGPYVKYGDKYVSLKSDDPYTVSLERALEVIRLKQEADANRIIAVFSGEGIQVLNGRYGPYVTDGKKNAKIPKDRDPKSLTLADCRELLEKAPERGARFGRGRRAAAAAPSAAADGTTAASDGQGKASSPARKRKGDGHTVGPARAARGRSASAVSGVRPRPTAAAARASAHAGSAARAARPVGSKKEDIKPAPTSSRRAPARAQSKPAAQPAGRKTLRSSKPPSASARRTKPG
jgi:DNA topoisomerase-1